MHFSAENKSKNKGALKATSTATQERGPMHRVNMMSGTKMTPNTQQDGFPGQAGVCSCMRCADNNGVMVDYGYLCRM